MSIITSGSSVRFLSYESVRVGVLVRLLASRTTILVSARPARLFYPEGKEATKKNTPV